MQIDWGSVPDWLAGGGAVVALLWARKAARAVSETNRQQAAQLKELEEDRRRTQADKVAAWIEVVHDNVHTLGEEPQARIRFVVRNASDLPVYFIHVWATTYEGATVAADILNAVPPGMKKLSPRCAANEFPKKNVERTLWTSMLFADSAGQFWTRDRSGSLKSIEFAEADKMNKELRALKLERSRGIP